MAFEELHLARDGSETLRQLDSELAEVEDALSERLQSLADVEGRLSDLRSSSHVAPSTARSPLDPVVEVASEEVPLVNLSLASDDFGHPRGDLEDHAKGQRAVASGGIAATFCPTSRSDAVGPVSRRSSERVQDPVSPLSKNGQGNHVEGRSLPGATPPTKILGSSGSVHAAQRCNSPAKALSAVQSLGSTPSRKTWSMGASPAPAASPCRNFPTVQVPSTRAPGGEQSLARANGYGVFPSPTGTMNVSRCTSPATPRTGLIMDSQRFNSHSSAATPRCPSPPQGGGGATPFGPGLTTTSGGCWGDPLGDASPRARATPTTVRAPVEGSDSYSQYGSRFSAVNGSGPSSPPAGVPFAASSRTSSLSRAMPPVIATTTTTTARHAPAAGATVRTQSMQASPRNSGSAPATSRVARGIPGIVPTVTVPTTFGSSQRVASPEAALTTPIVPPNTRFVPVSHGTEPEGLSGVYSAGPSRPQQRMQHMGGSRRQCATPRRGPLPSNPSASRYAHVSSMVRGHGPQTQRSP